MTKISYAPFLCAAIVLTACENPIKRAVREGTYSAYEMIGIEKRDLLKRRIATTREDQKEASESFKDALEKLRKLYDMPRTQLESQYRTVQSAYERADSKASEVRASREKMETVAHDLFREWEKEIGEIQTPELKASSREKLKGSRARFGELDKSLTEAEHKMDPVLVRLKDHVLYLKHNLNAESLASLKKEHDRIQGDIEVLIRDMNRSISQADEFIKTIP